MLLKQTQLYLRLSGYQVEDLKQLRVGQGRGTGAYVYNCHISFPNILVASTADLKHDEQERWIDGICLLCDGLALMMSHSAHPEVTKTRYARHLVSAPVLYLLFIKF